MSTTRVGKLQDGFTWGGVSVVNPFTAELHPLLEALLSLKMTQNNTESPDVGFVLLSSGYRTPQRGFAATS